MATAAMAAMAETAEMVVPAEAQVVAELRWGERFTAPRLHSRKLSDALSQIAQR
jgi:hypothetical protein